MLRARIFLAAALALPVATLAWTPLSGAPAQAQTGNKRLILKDGSYQIVTQYQVIGDRVRYFSAERAEWEELPNALVDWAATNQWAKTHAPGANAVSPTGSNAVPPDAAEAAAIDKEEQEERSRTPEVLPGLRLPDRDGVWALDTFQGQPELVGLVQNTGDVNQQTGHNILRSALNRFGVLKQSIQIPGAASKVHLHVSQPVLYVSLTTKDNDVSDEDALTVDTHGATPVKNKDSYSSPSSRYAIVRVASNLKHDYRVVSGVKIGLTGNASQTPDIVPTTAQVLPGGHWMKLTPREPLTIGDYALMEILAPGEVNASVWDFRVDPTAPDNNNAITPLQRVSR